MSADDGVYRFLNLVPGTYRLEVELTGFQRYVRDQIEVNVQSAPRIEVSLKVGSIAETIQVAGTAPVLQTENASVGLVVGSRPVQELPLNGRNVMNLITLAPSVVPQGSSEGSLTGKNVFAAGNFQVGGGTANQSASYFDGVPVQDSAYGNIVVLTPSPDSVGRVQGPDQQQQRRIRTVHRRRHQHGLPVGDQHLPRQRVRIPPEQGPQLQHVLRQASRAGSPAVRPEQFRRFAGRPGAERQAVLLRKLRRVPEPRRRALPPHRADGRDADRGFFELPERGDRRRRADLRSVDAVRHQQSWQRRL